MPKNYQPRLLLVWALVVATAGLPQTSVDEVPTSAQRPETVPTIDLPFLQFKNGGIRVNFAGYHAEAGLGGLLGGSDAKGGLFASAGTPWGPSASAGLGGSLGGQDGTARGGLHARAGLGNGRPEAAAGLGGSLDGSARSRGRASGGLYAGATAGGGPGAVAGLGGSVDGSGTPGGNTGTLYAGTTNGREGKITVKQTGHVQSVPLTRDQVHSVESRDKEALSSLEFKVPAAGTRNEISSSRAAGDIGNPGPKYDVVGANTVAGTSDGQDLIDVSYPTRRYYRKRNRNSPFRKSIYKFFTTNAESAPEVPAASASAHAEGGILAAGNTFDNRAAASVSDDGPRSVPNKPKRTTLFDDIFNIPISTLTAVNQLLNNKSG